MTAERYNALMGDERLCLDWQEISEGWHFCHEFDGLLVGPGMESELSVCRCLPAEHKVYNNREIPK